MTQKIIRDVTEADFQQWKHSPASKLYLRFLSDYADMLARALLEEFLAQGQIATSKNQEVRGRILAAKEASELEFSAIVEFYKQEEDDAAKASQD